SYRVVQLVAGLPDGRPRLAEIADAAAHRLSRQPDRRAAGEFEIDRHGLGIGHEADRQQRQDAVLLAAVKAAIDDAVNRFELDAAQGPLKRFFRPVGDPGLPAEAVGDQHKGPYLAVVGEILTRDEPVL